MILDVGCGTKPRGDVNVELYMRRSEHRIHDVDIKKIPNLVIASVNNLPFRSHVFHHAHCYSVLEHVGVNINLAVNELLRVSKFFIDVRVPSNYVFKAHPFRHKGHTCVFTSRMVHRLFKNYTHEITVECVGRLLRFLPLFVPLAWSVKVWK